jgi:hypothetical protein
LPSTDTEVVRLLKGLPATIAGHAKTLNTKHQIRYADGSWITVQPLVEAVGKGPGGTARMTTKDLFKVFTNRNRGQFQVNAQNAPGPRCEGFAINPKVLRYFSRGNNDAVEPRGYLMAEPGVEIAWGAVSRAWRKADHAELWLQFRPRGSKDALDAVEAAVVVADHAVEDAGWGEDVHTTGGASDSDAGPVVLMRRAGHEPGLRTWLGAFAHHLESLGKTGKVTAAPEAYFPDWFNRGDLPQELTAFVSYATNDLTQLGDHERRAGWHVPAAFTEKVTDAGATWGRFSGADVYLSRNIHQIRTKNPDVGRPLADGITKFGMAGVTYLRFEPRRMTSMYLSDQGQACYEVMDDTVSWQARLEQVAVAMAAFPGETDLAFLQYSNAYTISWGGLQTGRPPLPYVRASEVRFNRHLNSRYTPDAHGLQILTDAHLEKATDLSDWIIESLGGGKHFVQAKDLGRWYANIEPDPQTLAKARADFGKMILTPETLVDNPPPWN